MKFIGLTNHNPSSFASRCGKGWVILIGATTENPSFEVVSALLSRSQVYIFETIELRKIGRTGYYCGRSFNQDENTDFTI